MMQSRCSRSSSAHRSPVRPCPCGLFHEPGSSLCALYADDGVDAQFAGGVDCTLSLSTPSTRTLSRHTSNFCWDMFQPAKQQQQESIGGAYHKGRGGGGGEEALAARRCANCDTTSTPLWRNGPRGPKSLCNACGIRYKKEERRVSSTAAEEGQQRQRHSQAYSSWAYAQTQKAEAAALTTTEFRLIRGEDESSSSSSSDAPFLSWRLNVRDSSPGLLHDFS